MNIDIVIGVAERGGVENIIQMTTSFLNKKGYKVRIVQLVWEGIQWVDSETSFFPLLYGREGHNLDDLINAYQQFLEQEGFPDVVLAVAWPYISYISKIAVNNCEQKEIPVISWLHAPIERYVAAGYGGYESLQYANAHFAISNEIFYSLSQHMSKQVYRIYNPVEFPSSGGNQTVSRRNASNQLLYVGRISPEKHIDTILKALSFTKQKWKLQIIGSGDQPIENDLKQVAKQMGIEDRICWLGWKSNPWREAVEVDVVVLASEYEGFPLTVIEALAYGKTVISTPVDGVRELIIPGETGYLFGIGDSEMLAEILDDISSGVLKLINPKNCRVAVQCYERYKALEHFEKKLWECYHENEKFS